ncbi:hypothetical protein M5X00_17335 [Paenibacillus alvei]|uniref:hypothetical protein n=1 Tax=Paenibacillus alvei TaxID=44250 RepID=UPI00028990B2|nr:hypothetical protein [Paenibacillus alvei]EJW19182.1 hypothetical protein PAV_1c01530 [Paenibacillus alvei DSM 29]MCY9544229.1 hypothetical protein [Paenibacillus alvei]MCY9706345.1 hypothetical protein [Paenibacillus alvei]MCY9732219.1 hypothetical protein [Paenibacillus alvei]MCY9756003.1 hypothetical protein [Paenibacillus alvei]
MGCDIHLFVERKGDDGLWRAVMGVNEPKIEELRSYIQKDKERGVTTVYWETRLQEEEAGTFNFLHDGRNYNLFSILAGVRNNHRISAISEPRGLPDDVTEKVESISDEWGSDGHSHSYLSATELVQFDWNQFIKLEGWVDANNYKEFKEKGSPFMWSRSVGGGSADHVTHYDMESFIAKDDNYFSFGSTPYTLVQWEKSYRDCVGSFYTWSIPKIKELAGNDLESVRIVFWFDN